ncbi:MAG: PQQ-dependent sugar dehydrogenase [Alphaproteobacteria bacterium]|nr:PQQ-dependent sugar dehydrogenase [Alphaproteobacteria bacterium]
MPTFNGDGAANVLTGGVGADVISGFGGGDTLNGGDGDDIIYGHSQGASGAITSTAFVTGIASPVAASYTSADAGFLYVVEKDSGIIWRINEATGARTTFLDIPQGDFTRDGERGVLGLAFHPDYASNGRFFVFMTDAEGDLQVREYTRSAGDPAVANTASTLVIEVPKQTGQSNHNGGWIGFSPVDGYLYITIGDGGGAGDPNNFSQNTDVLLGKILRIDVNSDGFPADTARNYAIPANNPFVGVAGADEIWAYGVRNPWRLAFDPRNGDLYIADVGQGAREEIDYLASGAGGRNFGWRIMEGTLPFNPGPPGTPQPGDPSLTLPIYDYSRSLGASVTGGEVYVGNNAGFVGQYVFADFITNRLFSLSVANGAAVDVTLRTSQVTGAQLSSVTDFVTGANGVLYAIGIGGTVWRLTPQLGAEDVADTLNGGAGNDVMYGSAGNDSLNGGSGVDAAGYSIASTSATWIRNPNGTWTVTAGAEGVDTLASVEVLNFTDRNVVLDNAFRTFSGDGTSDLLWRNANTGAAAIWEMSGSIQTNAFIAGGAPSEWSILGTGDFSGDGRDDIIWRNTTTTAVAVWANGSGTAASIITGVPGNWQFQGVGDFNFDGRDDFVWRNSNDGAVAVWLMDGNTIASQSIVSAAPAAWAIAGIGDFDGDGRDDILLRNTDGTMARWTTDGVTQTGAAIIGSVPTSWQVQGIGDFDGDGRADILFRNTSDGGLAMWRMNGNATLGTQMIGGAPLSWSIANVGDYNGDGRDDILWHNTDGTVSLWTMNGFTVQNQAIVATVPTEWGLI